MTFGLPFKSIYTHIDNTPSEFVSISAYDQFLYAVERVDMDVGDGDILKTEIPTFYTTDGMFVSDDVEIIDTLIKHLANGFESIQCHRMAVIAKLADGPSWCTWTKGFKEFGIGYKPSYADSSHYLPYSMEDAQRFLKYWAMYEKNIEDAIIGFNVSKKEFYVKSECANSVWTVNNWFAQWGCIKYEALNENDCKKWAYESTFCCCLELTYIGECDGN